MPSKRLATFFFYQLVYTGCRSYQKERIKWWQYFGIQLTMNSKKVSKNLENVPVILPSSPPTQTTTPFHFHQFKWQQIHYSCDIATEKGTKITSGYSGNKWNKVTKKKERRKKIKRGRVNFDYEIGISTLDLKIILWGAQWRSVYVPSWLQSSTVHTRKKNRVEQKKNQKEIDTDKTKLQNEADKNIDRHSKKKKQFYEKAGSRLPW